VVEPLRPLHQLFAWETYWPALKGPPMTLLLVMVFVISIAMAIGFVLGRLWQMRDDLEQKLEARFAMPDENG
jgi:hypothetical protein